MPSPSERAPTRERILAATVTALARFGLGKLSLEDVAREAGVSRQTVYRYFGNKDALLRAAVAHEESRFLDDVLAAVDGITDLRPALERAIATTLQLAREHPVLDRLLATEPEAILPYLVAGEGPIVSAALPALERVLRDRLTHLSDPEVHRFADAYARLLTSYVIEPPDAPIDEVAAGLADLFVHGIKGG
ncbi:MAG: TetR/AcrR family transcriptional regulator [Actinobacteria bacterium]|nr:TetR/AcrR family transcriptional regulator [Actinomycetota bacterium]